MKRREFITLLGGAAAAWPLAARAQQPAMPVIGFLDAASPDTDVGPSARIPPGPEGSRLCRGRERGDRIPLGRESTRSAAGAGGRIGPPQGRRDRHGHGHSLRRSRPRRQPRRSPSSSPSSEDPVRLGLVASLARPGGNLTGINFSRQELAAKRLELLRELVPQRSSCGRARQSGQCSADRDHVERCATGRARHRAANPGPQRQHQPRDRCGLRNLRTRAARRPLRRQRRLFHQPACPIGPTGGAPRDPRGIFGA